jgi:hypothetical protein
LFSCFHILHVYVDFSSAFMQQQACSVAEREKSTCFSLLSLQYASTPWSSLSQVPSELILFFPFSFRAGMLRCTCVRPSYPFAWASRSTFNPFSRLRFPRTRAYIYIYLHIYSSLFQTEFTAGLLVMHDIVFFYCCRFPILSMLLFFSVRDNTFNLTISVVF